MEVFRIVSRVCSKYQSDTLVIVHVYENSTTDDYLDKGSFKWCKFFFMLFQPTLSNAQHMSLEREFKSLNFHNLDALTLLVRPAYLLLSCHISNPLLTLWTSMSSLVLSISSWIKTDYRVINAYKYCLLLKILWDHLLVIYGSSSKQFSQHLAPHSSVYESLLQYSRF